jgi:hypothetical protein
VTNEQVDVVVGGVHHGKRLPVGQEDTLPLPDPRQGATYPPTSQNKQLLEDNPKICVFLFSSFVAFLGLAGICEGLLLRETIHKQSVSVLISKTPFPLPPKNVELYL